MPFVAIWDTGATSSVITQRVVDACGLVATGIAQVQVVDRVVQSETYLVNIGLPDRVLITAVRVSKGAFVGGDILIGMDVMTKGDFAVTNYNGTTVFSFRIPSAMRLKFVKLTGPPSATEPIKSPARTGSDSNRGAW